MDIERLKELAKKDFAVFHVNSVRELIAEVERLRRLDERQARAVKVSKAYRDNYLLDEIDEPELCISAEQHAMLVELNDAINDCKYEPAVTSNPTKEVP